MKKYTLIFGLIALFAISCQNNKKQQTEDRNPVENSDSLTADIDTANRQFISETIEKFVHAYNARDNQAVNELIHPEIGIMFIHRPGAMDWYEKVKRIDFDSPVPSYYPYADATHQYPLIFGTIPVFSCETESWDKEGLFTDVIGQTNILRPIAEHLDGYEDVELGENYEEDIDKAEKNSYRVVLTTKTPLVFHVKEIDGKWYVTILDRAYGDCSA